MINEKWQQLNKREKQLVSGMVTVIVIFLFYSLIWQPLNDNIAKAEKKIVKQQQLLAWVQENTARYKQQNGGSKKQSKGSLSSIVNKTAAGARISIERIQQQGDDIQVWLEAVPFNNLLSWLEKLTKDQGLAIKNIDLSDSDQEGAVNVRRLQIGK